MQPRPRQTNHTPPETGDRLSMLETVIERGMQTFIEVGDALAEIRDSKLYRESHGTFAKYVEDRWGWSRRTAYDYIDGARVAGNVRTSAHLPSLGHAVALARLPDDQQAQVAPLITGLSVTEARRAVRVHRDEQERKQGNERAQREQAARIGDLPPQVYVERAWKDSQSLTLRELHEVILPRHKGAGWHGIGYEAGPGGRHDFAVRADVSAMRLLRPGEWYLDGDGDGPPAGWRRWSACWNVEDGYLRRDFWCDGNYSPIPSPWEEVRP